MGEFDVRRILLNDQAKTKEPSVLWSVSSLLHVVRQCADTAPFSLRSGEEILERQVQATSALAALGHLGWDFDSVYRKGFGQRISHMLSIFLRDETGPLLAVPSNSPSPTLQRWHAVLGESLADVAESSPEMREAELGRLLEMWLESAKLSELISWSPPDRQGIKAATTSRVWEDVVQEYRWAIDRLTRTYLGDWSDLALEAEYEYQFRGWKPVDLPLDQVRLAREISEIELTRAVADRKVSSREVSFDVLVPILESAQAAIEAGRLEAAVSMFEVALRFHPKSPQLLNNLGFCLIPIAPDRALDLFGNAFDSGFEERRLLACNIALAEVQMGHSDSARSTVLEALERDPGTEDRPAFLWSLRGPRLEELVSDKPSHYLRELLAWLDGARNSVLISRPVMSNDGLEREP